METESSLNDGRGWGEMENKDGFLLYDVLSILTISFWKMLLTCLWSDVHNVM